VTDAQLAAAWCLLLGTAQFSADYGDDSLLVQMEQAARSSWGRR
jgi:hypothetical protein